MVEGINKADRKHTPAEGITDAPMSHTMLMQLHNQVAGRFQAYWEGGEKNEQRWMGNNWNESQKSKIRRQKRQAYSLAILASKLRYITATQKQLRTSYKVEATSDTNDEVKAEVATIQMKAVESRSNAKYIDSDTFESGLAIKFGVRRVGLDTTSVIPRVKSYTVDWKNFVWDLNSRDYDIKKDALWCAEVEKVERHFLEKMYGEEAISGIAGSSTGGSAFNGRNKMSYYVNFKKDAGHPLPYDMIALFKHCQKVTRTYHYVLFADEANYHKLNTPVVGKYKTKEEAEVVLTEMNIPNLLAGLPEEGEIIEREEVRIDYYEFTYNKILYYEETEWEMFPYDVYFAIKFEDKFCSFQDFLDDPQKIIDRMWMQIDYSMGKDMKNVYEGNMDALHKSETPESAQAKASQTGGIIWTKSKDKVFSAIQSQGANPQWINSIEVMVKYLEDMTGGKTFQGQAEGKSQSGVAVKSLQQAGSVMASAFLDSFNRFKKAHGENILWWIREYEVEEDTIRIHGGQLTPAMVELLKEENIYEPSKKNDGTGFLTVNKGGISYLRDAEVELTVTEEAMTEIMRDKKYQQLTQAGKDDPYLVQSPTYRKLKLESMDISHEDKVNIIKEAEQQQQQAQEMGDRKNQVEEEKNRLQYGKDALDKAEQVANIRKTAGEAGVPV
jgi:hypothetical protein